MRLDIVLNDAKKVLKKVDFSSLKNKTVFLTGSTGLLGTHFMATLALLNEQGMDIKVFAQCHSKPADYTKQIAERGKIKLINSILYTYDPLNPNPALADVILHAAGFAQPVVFTASPIETININTTLTQRLLARVKPNGKFLFISSSEVYSGLSSKATEFDIGTTGPGHPRSCYIEGKRCGEAIVNAYRQGGVSAKSARLGLAYGPGTRRDDQRAMSMIIKQALTEGRIDLKYPGKELRTFCYVSDAIEMLWNVCLHGKQAVYNVGGPSTTCMEEIARKVSIETGATFDAPLPGNEMIGAGSVQMSNLRIHDEFGKNEYVGLDEGLRNTIEWNRQFYV